MRARLFLPNTASWLDLTLSLETRLKASERLSAALREGGSLPDPEVSERPQRRHFSAVYKAKIVQAADACTEPGQVGVLLRREGIYSSHLSSWRRLYHAGALACLRDDKRGRKPSRHPLEEENERLRKQLARTERRLQQAENIIDIQKKLRRCWAFR
ncbi:transposase [bacterium]|nr:transposase [bacterium]